MSFSEIRLPGAVRSQVTDDLALGDLEVEADQRVGGAVALGQTRGADGRSTHESDAGRIPEITEAKHRFFEDRFRRAQPVVSGAIARGELPADTDPAELVRTLVAPIYLRLLVTAEPIGTTTADNAAKVALAAARADALRSDPLPEATGSSC